MVLRHELALMNYTEYRIHKFLVLYIPPFLLLFGVFGNVLAFWILTRKTMRRHATYIYLAVLAIADTSVLIIGLFRWWIGEVLGHDLRDMHDWSCKLISVIGYTSSDFSVWLIIAVTFERFIVACYPLRAPTMCHLTKSKYVVGGLLGVMFLIHLHFIWTVQTVYLDYNGYLTARCARADDRLADVLHDAWPWVDAFIYSFIPFVIIIVLNTLIIRQIIKAKKLRHRLTVVPCSLSTSSLYPRLHRQHCLTHQPTQHQHHRSTFQDSRRLTAMLLAISFTFLLTTLPMNVSLIFTAVFWKQDTDDLAEISRLRCLRTVVELLMYFNHSINFYLYCATGRKFRHHLRQLLTYPCRNRPQPCLPTPENTHFYHSASPPRANLPITREPSKMPQDIRPVKPAGMFVDSNL